MKQYFTLILLVLPILIFAQNREQSITINTSYFGRIFTHPGIKIGTDISLFTLENAPNHSIFINNNLGYYYHKNNHHGLFLNSEIGYEIAFQNDFFTRGSGGIGYLRTFLDGTTYEMNENGVLEPVRFAGNDNLMFSANLTFGKKLHSKILDAWFIHLGSFWQYPVNEQFLLNPTLELGVRWNFKRQKT